MKQNRFTKAGILAVVLIAATLISWETHLRQQGRPVAYDDGGPLWSASRKEVYAPADKATVFIGSSRIKYDLDISTWQRLTGERAIQLANVGSSPLPVLYDLADDEAFKGKLVIDVSEFLFFNNAPFVYKTPEENLSYYRKETFAQRFGFFVNSLLESQFLFIDKEEYSLNALLAVTAIPNREKVYEFPDFPASFTPVTRERQSYMTDKLVHDPKLLKRVTDVWELFGKMGAETPPITDGAVDSIITAVATAVEKIKSRGGKVIFVRPPSSGPFLAMEKMAFPRERFWNKLLAGTSSDGIHFQDYPETAGFECPEFSHLSLPQAREYTRSLVHILQQKDWNFTGLQQTNASTPK